MVDTAKFKSILALKKMTISELAEKIGISYSSLSYKINNIREFKPSEIKIIQSIWGLSNDERDDIFLSS